MTAPLPALSGSGSLTKAERWARATEMPLLALGLAFLVAYATPLI
ncbi:MAG: hypothetical protein JWO10_1820, partial [Microbacteriaceae bacterium]|nr:hypothetical protein [Microbacteriaceae bacterium]